MNLDEAANALEHLLDQIVAAPDDNARTALKEQVLAFRRSLPWEPEFAELRRIAQDTFDELGRKINQSVLSRMAERGKELSKYVETVSAVTNRAEKNIETLRLKHVQQVVGSVTVAMEAVKSVKASIAANDLPAASLSVDAALDTLLNLINEVSKIKDT